MASNLRKKSTGDMVAGGKVCRRRQALIQARKLGHFELSRENGFCADALKATVRTAKQSICLHRQLIASARAIPHRASGWLMRWMASKFFRASTLGRLCWATSATF